MRQRLRAFLRVVCGVVVILAAAVVLMWLFGRESEVRFRGIVDSGAENVGPVESARIVSIEVEPGPRVRAGDVLVRFDAATLLAEQARMRAERGEDARESARGGQTRQADSARGVRGAGGAADGAPARAVRACGA